MSIVTIDFETYYDKEFSLSKMTTEEYINDPRFEVIGAAIKYGDTKVEWFAGGTQEFDEAMDELRAVASDCAILCHNTMFDGAILAWKYNINPGFWFDTLSMARAIHGVDAGGSLKALAERYQLGQKGTEVLNALGKRRADFTPEDLARYGDYCKNDVDLTAALFAALASSFPNDEFNLIDMTLRMYTQPALRVDDALLVTRLEDIKQEKSDLLAGLMLKMGCDTEEAVRSQLSSNKQFAQVLQSLGIAVPLKVSATTGKDTYALAKNDEGFIALTEHEDPFIQQLCAVRLGTKSTIEESRVSRFIGVGARNRGTLPVPLKYYGAHTGRWAGQDKINFQNLPSRDKKKKALKNAVMAPDGHYLANCDSSQIEARILAWWAGQDDVVSAFANGEDVYSIFASKIYDRPISKADPTERFVGKTCLAAGTRVLTRRGWVPIINVTISDQLWDGVEWVNHQGVSYMGLKQTIKLHGVELTPDHEILTGRTKWVPASYALAHGTVFQSALNSVILPSSDISNTIHLKPGAVGGGCHFVDADAAGARILWQDTISAQEDLPHVIPAQSAKQGISVGGNTRPLCQMTFTEVDYSTDSLLLSPVATIRLTPLTNITASVKSLYSKNGVLIGLNSCDTSKHLKGGINQNFKWIASTLIRGMSRGISGLCQLVKTWLTKDASKTLKPVYDVLNCGSRNRFTVLTDRGPIIVHNCILGLGFGTGAEKLRHTLKTQPPGAVLTVEECQAIVSVYRSTNYMIPQLWQECDQALRTLMGGGDFKPFYLGKHRCVQITPQGVKLPNGLYIRYTNLRLSDDGGMVYDSRKGSVYIWGGAMVENIVQALARIVVGKQLLWVNESYPLRLAVHDAGVWAIPKPEIETAKKVIIKAMSTAPDWAYGLPVTCEFKYAERYGEC